MSMACSGVSGPTTIIRSLRAPYIGRSHTLPHQHTPPHDKERNVICRGFFGDLFGGLKGGQCGKCKGKGSVTCPGCKGGGRNKKNGNVFERYKCYDCQGFGLVKCPSCGKSGLTPEQRGER